LGLLRNCSRTHADCALKAAGARRSTARLALSFPCLALSRARPAALSLTLVVTGLLTATEKRVTPIVVTRARLPDGTPRSPAAARCSPLQPSQGPCAWGHFAPSGPARSSRLAPRRPKYRQR